MKLNKFRQQHISTTYSEYFYKKTWLQISVSGGLFSKIRICMYHILCEDLVVFGQINIFRPDHLSFHSKVVFFLYHTQYSSVFTKANFKSSTNCSSFWLCGKALLESNHLFFVGRSLSRYEHGFLKGTFPWRNFSIKAIGSLDLRRRAIFFPLKGYCELHGLVLKMCLSK